MLICNFQLEYQPIERQYDIDFSAYFAEDLARLRVPSVVPFGRLGP